MNSSETTMNRRDVVSFSADFPDDSQWDEQGTEILPGGRAIAQTIRSQLEGQAVSCSEIVQHSTYGWVFYAVFEYSKVRILLAAAEGGWLAQLAPRQSFIRRLLASPQTGGLETIQQNLHNILVVDKRFSGIKWYVKKDYDRRNEARASDSPY